jgi:hypothetical protein
LGKAAADSVGGGPVLDRVREQPQDVIVPAEVGEVLEREIDGSEERARTAERPELVPLSLPADHALTIRHPADLPLLRD